MDTYAFNLDSSVTSRYISDTSDCVVGILAFSSNYTQNAGPPHSRRNQTLNEARLIDSEFRYKGYLKGNQH